MNINISDESVDRVENALEEIDCCCNIEDDYAEWYDIAMECVLVSFEGLNDHQIFMTYAAWEEKIYDTVDVNYAKGLTMALLSALKDYVYTKEMFILECNLDDDEYDDCEAVTIKKAFEECIEDMQQLLYKDIFAADAVNKVG